MIRNAKAQDAPIINRVLPDWWGKSFLDFTTSRVFLHHFADTCLVSENKGKVNGFLIGFRSQMLSSAAYVRLVVVDPAYRRGGIGRALYTTFFGIVEKLGIREVEAVTSPNNKGSIRFHKKLQFEVIPSEHIINGVPVYPDYHGRPNSDRVVFRRRLDSSVCNSGSA